VRKIDNLIAKVIICAYSYQAGAVNGLALYFSSVLLSHFSIQLSFSPSGFSTRTPLVERDGATRAA
jgi:hypothetical protein